jgi:hypothetical protein
MNPPRRLSSSWTAAEGQPRTSGGESALMIVGGVGHQGRAGKFSLYFTSNAGIYLLAELHCWSHFPPILAQEAMPLT